MKEAQAARDDVGQWALAVRQLYDKAPTWLAAHTALTAEERQQQYLHLYQCAWQLGQCYDSAHPCWALAKRLLRHREELFQFVLLPG